MTASSPLETTLLLGTLVTIFGVTLRPNLMIYLFIFGGFFDSVNLPLGNFYVSLADVTSLGLVGSWILRLLLQEVSFKAPKGSGWLLLFWAWSALSLIFSESPQDVVGRFIRFSNRVVAVFALVSLLKDVSVIRRCLYLIGFSGIIHASLGLLLDEGGGGRMTGIVNQPNIFSMHLAMSFLPLISMWTIHKTMSRKTFAVFGAALMTTGIILAGSRTTFVGLMIALLWFTRSSLKISVLVLVCCLFGYQAATVFSQESVDTMQNRITLQDQSIRQRKDIFKTAVEVIEKFPVFGAGYGQFAQTNQIMNIENNRGRASHSYYIGIAASIGIPGLLAILLFLATQAKLLFVTMRRYSKPGDAFNLNWSLCNTISVIFLFQMSTLMGRGTQFCDWTLFAMYAASTMVFERQQGHDTAAVQSGISPSPTRTSSAGSLTSNKLV